MLRTPHFTIDEGRSEQLRYFRFMHPLLRQHRWSILLVAIVAVAAVFSSWCIHPGHNWGDDFALYMDQAQPQIYGTSDDLIQASQFTAEHSDVVFGPQVYPPGFPLLLSPFMVLFPLNFPVLKGFCAIFFLLTLLVLFRWFRQREIAPMAALAGVVMIGWHPVYLGFTDQVLSDLPFLFFSTLALLFLGNHRQGWSYNLKLGIILIAAVSIREVGLLLVGPLLLVLWSNRREAKPSIFLPLAMVLGVGGWMLLGNPANTGVRFQAWEFLSLESIWSNAIYYGELLLHFPAKKYFWLQVVTGGAFLGFAVFGAWKTRRDNGYILVYVLLILLFCLVWPAQQKWRFLLPILPALVLFFLQGIGSLKEFKLISRPAVFLGLMVVLIGAQGAKTAWAARDNNTNQAFTSEMKAIYTTIQELNSEHPVIFFKPRLLRMVTRVKAFYRSNPEDWKNYPNHLVIWPRAEAGEWPLLQAVEEFDEWGIYRISEEN